VLNRIFRDDGSNVLPTICHCVRILTKLVKIRGGKGVTTLALL